MITDYDVIAAGTITALRKRVNEWIREGWVPLGGVAIDRPSATPFNQAMVRNYDELKGKKNEN
jgi:hypothetical protein